MIHWTNIVFVIVIVILLYLTLRDNSKNSGNYYSALSVLDNVFWGFVLILFVVLWGGIFWW